MEVNNMLEKIKTYWNSWSMKTKIAVVAISIIVILLVI